MKHPDLLPIPTTPEAYAAVIVQALAPHTDAVTAKLAQVVAAIPDTARAFEIVIFLDQDEEGCASAGGSCDGPDLYVLNTPMNAVGYIFDTVFVARSDVHDDIPRPVVPMMEGWSDNPFPVNDTLADILVAWLSGIWRASGLEIDLPASILVHDEWGSTPFEPFNDVPVGDTHPRR